MMCVVVWCDACCAYMVCDSLRRVLCIYGVRLFLDRVCILTRVMSHGLLLPFNPPGRQPGRHPAAGDRTGPPKPRPRANAVMLSLSLTPARLFFFCCVPFSPRGLLLPRLPLPNPSFLPLPSLFSSPPPLPSLPPLASPRLPNINKHDTNVDRYGIDGCVKRYRDRCTR